MSVLSWTAKQASHCLRVADFLVIELMVLNTQPLALRVSDSDQHFGQGEPAECITVEPNWSKNTHAS